MELAQINETTTYTNLIAVFNANNIPVILVTTMVGILAITIIGEKIFDIDIFRNKFQNTYFFYFLDLASSALFAVISAIFFVAVLLGLILVIEIIIRIIL